MKIFVLPQEQIYVEGFTDSYSTYDTSSSSSSHDFSVSMSNSHNNDNNNNAFDFGDLVNLTCVSGASKPPPKMAWFINGDMVRKRKEERNSFFLPSLLLHPVFFSVPLMNLKGDEVRLLCKS